MYSGGSWRCGRILPIRMEEICNSRRDGTLSLVVTPKLFMQSEFYIYRRLRRDSRRRHIIILFTMTIVAVSEKDVLSWRSFSCYYLIFIHTLIYPEKKGFFFFSYSSLLYLTEGFLKYFISDNFYIYRVFFKYKPYHKSSVYI